MGYAKALNPAVDQGNILQLGGYAEIVPAMPDFDLGFQFFQVAAQGGQGGGGRPAAGPEIRFPESVRRGPGNQLIQSRAALP